VYENSGHFKFEMLRIAWDRWARAMTQDHFLSNFASVWRGLPHDETGIAGSEPPKWWTDAYIKLQKQDNPSQGQFNLPNSELACYFDPDTGHLVVQGANGRPPDTLQPSNQEPTHASYDLPPQMKENMRRNLKEMERWARASSKAYPRSK
jgi:hypothetical protein